MSPKKIDWLGLYDLGYSVFPVRKGDKLPAVKWKRFQEKRASREKVEEWSRTDCNIGIATGAISNLVVLDLDTQEAVITAKWWRVPESSMVKTAKGWHVYYSHPGGIVKNRAGFWPGMDLRGDGGYVVGPGSIHPSGAEYRLAENACLDNLAPMQDWLLDALKKPQASLNEPANDIGTSAYGKAALQSELDELEHTPEGGRNDQLNKSTFAIAQLAASGVIDEASAQARLYETAEGIGLDAEEINKTIKGAWTAGLAQPRKIDLKRKEDGQGAGEAPKEVHFTAKPFPWADPAAIPPRPWVYGRWLLRGAVTAVIAPGGVGKSLLMAGTALALSSGKEVLGKTIWGGPQRVWLWNLEDDGDELSRQLTAFAIHHGITKEDCADRLFVDSAMDGAGLCTATEDKKSFRIIEPVYEALLRELINRQIDVLIVDPFVSSHAVDENANTKIDAIAKKWGRLAKQANCVIVLVHHSRKLGDQKVTAETSRGASALINAVRSALVLNRMSEKEAKSFGIEGEDQRRRYFSVVDDKHNRAPPENADWYRMTSVPLGNGVSNGMGGTEGGDNVGVVEPWTPPNPFDGVDDETIRKVQRVVADGQWRHSSQAKDGWVGIAIAEVLGLDPDDPIDKRKLKRLIKAWIDDGHLKVVEKKDKGRQMRPFIEVDRPIEGNCATSKGGAEQGGAGPLTNAHHHPPL